MTRFRLEIIVGVVSATTGALVGAFITWSVNAVVTVPGWLLGALGAGLFGSIALTAFLVMRLARLRSVQYDSSRRVYMAASPNAVSPGPFCAKCYDADGKLVNVRMDDDRQYWCASCQQVHYFG